MEFEARPELKCFDYDGGNDWSSKIVEGTQPLDTSLAAGPTNFQPPDFPRTTLPWVALLCQSASCLFYSLSRIISINTCHISICMLPTRQTI